MCDYGNQGVSSSFLSEHRTLLYKQKIEKKYILIQKMLLEKNMSTIVNSETKNVELC